MSKENFIQNIFLFLLINIFIFIYYKVSNHTKKIIRVNFYSIIFIIYISEFSLNFFNFNSSNDVEIKSELLRKEGKVYDTRKN